jgi:hypothetical protein
MKQQEIQGVEAKASPSICENNPIALLRFITARYLFRSALLIFIESQRPK